MPEEHKIKLSSKCFDDVKSGRKTLDLELTQDDKIRIEIK